MPLDGVAGVILAGGRGERLGGVTKAHLKVVGVRLVDRVLRALEPQCAIVVLSTGRLPTDAIRAARSLPAFPDSDAPDSGPVGGLSAAVAWSGMQAKPPTFLLTVAVDTPFFPDDFGARALDLMSPDIDVVMGAFAGQIYPTNALWRVASLSALPALVAAGHAPRGLKAVIPEERAKLLDYRTDNGHDPFVNINTVADLIDCGRRAYSTMNAKQSNSGLGKADQTG